MRWGVHETPFGRAFLAETPRGLCRFEFLQDDEVPAALDELGKQWWAAEIREAPERTRRLVERMFDHGKDVTGPLSLHVSGTNFQVRVWRALLAIPEGRLASYRQLAEALGKPGSARAVGQAVGANPVAFVVPCHRVIQSTGGLGGYRWGKERKRVMQAWEQARIGR